MSLVTPYSRPDQCARRSIRCRSFTSAAVGAAGERSPADGRTRDTTCPAFHPVADGSLARHMSTTPMVTSAIPMTSWV
jgi:hypothetical protein